RLTGTASGKQLTAPVHRLKNCGLSTWNAGKTVFDNTQNTHVNELIAERLQHVANSRRLVPVPRRTLRWLARATRPALVATVLGHLLRCVYAKGGQIAAEGSISASWVAGVFGVDQRSVKRAKAQLRALNWVVPKQTHHWHRQRYGGRAIVNLTWGGEGVYLKKDRSPRIELSPRPRLRNTELSPPDSNKKLPMEVKNQKPVHSRASGVHKSVSRQPHLSNVKTEDLQDAGRVLMLYDQATARGLIGRSESDRLKFVGAAIRARSRATHNPGGFFWQIVREKLWHHITAAEEDCARLQLRQYLYEGKERATEPLADDAGNGACEADIRFVAIVTKNLHSHGYMGDPYQAVAKRDPRWTRQRWDIAMHAWLTPRRTWAA
ncbi:MAG TPA: hypothetical protein VG722_13340, partial [Tepidisphaeraceae bacterium]|nr:hypothetical protein [Tepidisphaeraceae bacterium]